jgi:uncharacterized protein
MKGSRTPAETLEHLRKEAKRQLKKLKSGDEQTLRWYRRLVPDPSPDPTLRDVQRAVARSLDFPGWADLKCALETPLPDPQSREGIVSRFLDNACPDHHVRGRQDHRRAEATAMRLFEQHPWIQRYNINTAIACLDVDYVSDAIRRNARIAVEPVETPSAYRAMSGGANDLYGHLGPKGWTPLLYLAFTRLPILHGNDNALEIARFLLDAGADPNAFFHAGDSHYTPMTGVAGEGEEDRPPHPQRSELTQLFLEYGANPYDIQVVYDLGFHSEYMWWLPMIYAHAEKAGRLDDWRDPEWKMLDMGGYGCGARWFLDHAINHGKVELAQWCLEHGANPNAPPARSKLFAQKSLYESALENGQPGIAELLLRHGATRVPRTVTPVESLTEAAMRLDRARVDETLREHPSLRSRPEPLFRAAERNRADVIHLLIDAGFSPDVADDQNTRPLNYAAWSNALEAANALVARGAEVDNVEKNYGGTPLGNATHFLYKEVSDFLASRSNDIWNLTYNGYLERLREVLAEQPERARVDWDTWSPLLWLPPDNEDLALEMAKLYVQHGADPHRRDSNGVSPADRAEAIGMTRLAAYLRT